ncbi:MAG: protein kinase domain-containing protein [Dolichospermum sp.]
MSLNKGTLVGGIYEIIGEIDKGSFGEIYQAKDTQNPDRCCVIKHLIFNHNDTATLNKAIQLFKREVEILLYLTNTYQSQEIQIPKLYDDFEENQQFYLVEEFIEGVTIAQELKNRNRFSEDDAIDFLKQTLPILDIIHSHNIIHRDIKPDNLIRRSQDDKIFLIDFGAAKHGVKPEIDIVQTVIGTPSYASPELHIGNPRFNSDIYSLGIITIEALTGLKPVNIKDQTGQVIWPNDINISEKFAALLEKMVCNNYEDRYQTATEVLNAIKNLNGTLIISSQSASLNIQAEETSSFVFPEWMKWAGITGLVSIFGLSLSFLTVRAMFTPGVRQTQENPIPSEPTRSSDDKSKTEIADSEDKKTSIPKKAEQPIEPSDTGEIQDNSETRSEEQLNSNKKSKDIEPSDTGDIQDNFETQSEKQINSSKNSNDSDVFLRPKKLSATESANDDLEKLSKPEINSTESSTNSDIFLRPNSDKQP